MGRAGLAVGVVALVALGGYASRPDQGPEYLGDMPSILEQAESATPAPPEFVPPPDPPPVDPLRPPAPVAAEAPPPVPGGPGERVPDPVTDSVRDSVARTSGNGAPAPRPTVDLGDALPCVGELTTILKPGQGLFDCATGELLQVDDPVLCEIELPPLLQLGCTED